MVTCLTPYFNLNRYVGELPYPQVSLSASSQLNLNLGTHGMNAPNTCFIPIVAGPLLQDLPAIVRKVDSLGQEMQKIPYAIFLLGDHTSIEPDMNRHHMSPAVVSIFCLEKHIFYSTFHRSQLKQKQMNHQIQYSTSNVQETLVTRTSCCYTKLDK